MRNFDIEHLERKNIYKTPDNFFEEMQKNVLQNIAKEQTSVQLVPEKPQGKIIKMNWWYAAAAIALLFGMVFFFNNDSQITTPQNFAQQTVKEDQEETLTIGDAEAVKTTPSVENYALLTNDIADAEPQQKTIETQPIVKNNTISKTLVATSKPVEQVEQILDALSTEDIVALTQNADQDVYLDLYN